MKCWKKSIKYKNQPLLSYLNSGALKESTSTGTPSVIRTESANFDLSLAFKELESRLLFSLQEVITTSIGSLKTSIESEIKSLHTKVGELTERIQQLEAERSAPAPDAPMQCENVVNHQQDISGLQEVIHSTVTSLLSEEKEKERRKLSLIFHRIPESASEDSLERKTHDIEQVCSVLQNYLKVDVEVESAVRLGKKDPGKTRLLKVDVSSEKMKKMVLRNSVKLRDESNPDYIKKIFITPDLTPKEQEENKLLREKLFKMNKGGKVFRIKNGQIVWRDGHQPLT